MSEATYLTIVLNLYNFMPTIPSYCQPFLTFVPSLYSLRLGGGAGDGVGVPHSANKALWQARRARKTVCWPQGLYLCSPLAHAYDAEH